MVWFDETEQICESAVEPANAPYPSNPPVVAPLDLPKPSAKKAGHTGCMISTGCTHNTITNVSTSVVGKATETCLDSRNVLCPIPGSKNYGGRALDGLE